MSTFVRTFICLFFLLNQTGFVCADTHQVKIGVLAKRGSEITLKRWSNTAQYLSQTIPDRHFEIVPLLFDEIHQAVESNSIDFVLANPAFYVELEKLYGINRIATLINRSVANQQTTIFGSVIFTRANAGELKDLDSLRGRSFLAVDPKSFGGWIMAWREFFRMDIAPYEDFSSLTFADTHDAVVYGVLKGKADAGSVRTDTLERMAADGNINLKDISIINKKQDETFPFLLSTDLYPEWPMAALKTTPNMLSRKVASALMAMGEQTPAAVSSNTAGWTVPHNYQPVHECLLDLKIGPYKDYGKITLKDVFIHYWRQIILALFALLLLLSVSIYIFRLNLTLRQKKQEVDSLNRTLEEKVMQRTEKINTLLTQEIYLRDILQTVADINELLVTSVSLHSLLFQSCKRFISQKHFIFCWIGLIKNNRLSSLYTSEDEKGQGVPLSPSALADKYEYLSQSPSMACITSNKAIVLTKNDPSFNQIFTNDIWAAEARAFIALPLRADQSSPPIGVLTIYSKRDQGFEKEEISMLEDLAGDIGFAVESFRQRKALARLTAEQTENYEQTLFSLVNMIEQRDTYTAGHTSRVASYCQLIAMEMGLDEQETEKLQKAAILHDIGKIATPDSVLLKPGKLTPLDYDLIKLHALAGYQMLSQIKMYKELAEIIRHHHERFDGNGYPDGLKGDTTPLLARIMIVADSFDAMTTNRIYKPRKEISEAIEELQTLRETQFDPHVVNAAVKVLANVHIPSSITQLPQTTLEKRRFAYFFNDKLTGLYNEDYLKIILQNNQDLYEYKCLYLLHLQNVQDFNKREGWEKGNDMLKNFAAELLKLYPDSLVFRAYGNDFAVISKKHFSFGCKKDCSFASTSSTGITVEVEHMDIMDQKSYTIDKLEKLELLSQEIR